MFVKKAIHNEDFLMIIFVFLAYIRSARVVSNIIESKTQRLQKI